MIKNNTYRPWMVLGLTAALASGNVFPAFAGPGDQPEPGSAYEAELLRLQDNHMEYDELEGLIKNYYGPIKSGYDMVKGQIQDNGLISASERVMADDLYAQADDLYELAKEQTGMDKAISTATAQALRANARKMRSAAASLDRSLSRSEASSEKQLNRQVNALVMSVQSLMNQYEQLLSQRQVAAKGLELSQAAQALQQTMQAQGMAVDGDVISAAAQLSSTQAGLNALDAGIEQIHKLLCNFTGWGLDGNPEIGPVPSADIEAISAIDVNADKERAVGNNYQLISLRGSSDGGMTDLQNRTTKSTTQRANKLRNVEYSENTVRSDIQTLYDTILEKKAAYDSAATAYESAKIAWNAAQIQKQNGSLSQIQFLQQELSFLQAQSGFQCADLSLRQAMEDYNWAVRGVQVDASAK